MNQRDNPGHLSESELQELLDRSGGSGPAGEHLSGCPSCRGRLEEYRSLYSALDSIEILAPPARLERNILAALFPAPARKRAWLPPALPRWAPVAAMLVLVLSTMISVNFLGLLGIVIGPFAEAALESRLEYFLIPLGLIAKAFTGLSAVGPWLGGLGGEAQALLSALLHLWDAPEFRLLVIASAGLYSLIALGWGTRHIITRSRGGIHHVVLG